MFIYPKLNVPFEKINYLLIIHVCLFGVFGHTRDFFTNFEVSPLLGKAENFDLCKALMAVKQ